MVRDPSEGKARNFEKESEANASAIKSEIGSLASGHWAGLTERDYKSFWEHAKEIGQMFKTLKPLSRENGERLWQKFNGLCEETRRKQNEAYDNRKFKSNEHRKDILNEAEHARPCELPLGSIAPGLLSPDVEEMKYLGRVLKNAGRMLSEHKTEMSAEHKRECFDRIQEVQHDHDVWWKEHNNQWEEHRNQKAQRHDNFQARVRANISANQERLQKAIEARDRWERNADNLRDIINSAESDSHREKAEGWLSEAEDKIRDIDESIERIEGWIREDEEKLS